MTDSVINHKTAVKICTVAGLVYFITGIFFLTGENIIASPQTAAGALSYSTGAPPGEGLIVILSQFFLIIPLGSQFFRLALMNLIVSSLAVSLFVWVFYKETNNILPGVLLAIILGFTQSFFITSTTFSSIPATLCAILISILLFNSQSIRQDLRKALLLAFIAGLTYSSLHPSIRFLVPIAGFVWLFSYRVSPVLFSLIPFSFISGLGTILFIPVTARRSPDPGIQKASLGVINDIINMHSTSGAADLRNSPLNPAYFIPNLTTLLSNIWDNFPVFLLPFTFLALIMAWRFKMYRVYAFAGLFAASVLYTVWMMPQTISNPESRILPVTALIFTAGAGLTILASSFKNNIIRLSFILTMIVPGMLITGMSFQSQMKFHQYDLSYDAAISLSNFKTILTPDKTGSHELLIADYIICSGRKFKYCSKFPCDKTDFKDTGISPGVIISENYTTAQHDFFLSGIVKSDDRLVFSGKEFESIDNKLTFLAKTVETIRKKAADSAHLWAEHYLRSGHFYRAQLIAVKGQKILPGERRIKTSILGVTNALGRYDLTIRMFNSLIREHSPSQLDLERVSKAWYLGHIDGLFPEKLKQKALEKALNYINQALAFDKKSINNLVLKTMILKEMGLKNETAMVIDTILKLDSSIPEIRKLAREFEIDLSNYAPPPPPKSKNR
ncbi:tetratricopeptide repeat protein [Myxococcota bacterium]|nr:tetratricopeptide repeat protein [Myxococcota bacterium]MBU1379698.1 tetratricopeptide repeat protein [Myxococcota bacterium]MBU1496909.1 tetratricopeptide repeat protein [Myxococcota bacterium]